jgi:prepilin-type N-terminal cleavage/methylation domain-containing protein
MREERMKTPRLKNKGFALAELLVAAAIMSIAVTGLLALAISCMVLNETNNNLVTAAHDAQYVLEQIKGVAYSDITSYTAPSLNNLNNETITITFEPGSKVTGVEVDVGWTQMQGERHFVLYTRFAKG